MIHPASRLAACSALLVLAETGRAGAVAIHHGGPGQPGPVRAYDEHSGALVFAPPELAAVELLPFDAAGRTALEEFLPGRARRLDDVAGAARLVLPSRSGSLYHYVRAEAGARHYGYFVVRRDGEPRVLFERAGTGPAGDENPFLERVAVAPDGGAFLCATRAVAGGDLFEVRSSAGSVAVIERTAQVPPQRFSARGLALTATHVWAIGARGVLRAERASAGDAQGVGFGALPAPQHFQGDLALSLRGTAVAFHAGDGPDALHAWTATSQGLARRASTGPGRHSGAGLMPAAVDGPHLAVSDDGAWCAWRVETPDPLQPGAFVRDALLARTAAPAGEVQEVLTADARFLDTLDEVAVFFFRGPGRLVFAVGEQGAGTGIEGLDLFRAARGAGSTSAIENLTGTSGDFQEPFTALPRLKPTRWLMTPDRAALLLHDEDGNSGDLYAVDLATGAQTVLLADVKSFDWVELAGRRFAFGVQRRPDVGPRPHEVHSIAHDLAGLPALAATYPELEPTLGRLARADGWVSWTRTTLAGEILERARLPGGAVQAWPLAGSLAPGHANTADGVQAFVQAGTVHLWAVNGSAQAWTLGGPLQVLPGA